MSKIKYPYIEEQDYSDRTEFRVMERHVRPYVGVEKNRKKEYCTMYAASWVQRSNGSGRVDYVFTAYKRNGWLNKLLDGSYEQQKAKCIAKCRELMKEEEKPRVRRL